MNVGNDLASVCNVMTGLGDRHVRVYRKFCLEIDGQ